MSITVATISILTVFLPTDADRQTKQPDMDMNAPVVSSVNEAPQRWVTSFDEARKLAAQHDLPMLLHFDAKWCGACRQMEANVLHKPDVTAMLGSVVIGVQLDADQNKDLIREFDIKTLPTEIVVQPDGTRGTKMTGAVSMSGYISRLKKIGKEEQSRVAHAETKQPAADVRSCLIVRRDGKMVGLGGFSPVALVAGRKWIKGNSEFVAVHEGVEYFLSSEKELATFNADPENYIPRMHGCDLVELYLQNRATTGAIEYGSFYQGKVFFFASLENRSRFENNPAWYLSVNSDARTVNNELYPFLNQMAVNN